MPTVYMMCGLPGSGKSTDAAHLEKDKQAIRFSLDERMLAKHNIPYDDDRYDGYATAEKTLIWYEAISKLGLGSNVILDWNFWNAEQRSKWAKKIRNVNATPILRHINVPDSINEQRLFARNLKLDSTKYHCIPVEELRRFRPIFELPRESEGFQIEKVYN